MGGTSIGFPIIYLTIFKAPELNTLGLKFLEIWRDRLWHLPRTFHDIMVTSCNSSDTRKPALL